MAIFRHDSNKTSMGKRECDINRKRMCVHMEAQHRWQQQSDRMTRTKIARPRARSDDKFIYDV